MIGLSGFDWAVFVGWLMAADALGLIPQTTRIAKISQNMTAIRSLKNKPSGRMHCMASLG